MLTTQAVASHLSSLGLSINMESFSLMPQQTLVYLDIHLDSVSMTACLPDTRREDLLQPCTQSPILP